MIQRIQTLYVLAAIICLSMVTAGNTLFSYLSETMRYKVSSFGVTQHALEDDKLINTESFMGYTVGAGLLLIALVTLISFKDVKRQHRFGRMLFYAYFAVLISVMVFFYIGDSQVSNDITSREMGMGLIFLIIGFPFVFLANTGINRDKKLLDSLNRLR